MVMVSKEKDRVIVSLPRSTIVLLDKLTSWYVCEFHPLPASKSEVIDDAIKLFAENVGVH